MMDAKPRIDVVLEEKPCNDGNWTHLHQCMLMLLDSPLNIEGHLNIVIKLHDGRVVKVHREMRVPRTLKRFEQLFQNFLDGCSMPVVHTRDGPTKLLQMSPTNSVQKLIAKSCPRFRICNLAPRCKRAHYFAQQLDTHERIVLFVEFGPVEWNCLCDESATSSNGTNVATGDALHHNGSSGGGGGDVTVDGEITYAISEYPIAASLACAKLTSSIEQVLGVH